MAALDIIVAACTGWMAVVLFSLDIITGRKHRFWINLPEYVRWGFRLTGAAFMFRSVNLINLTSTPATALGHVNYEAVTVSLVLAYTVTAWAAFMLSDYIPQKVRDRMDWVRDESLKSDRELAPVLMPLDEVAHVAQATGAAAIGPMEPASAAFREGPRLHRAYERRDHPRVA